MAEKLFGPTGLITHDELGLAARNHGFPLEALRDDLTPIGLHYLLIHYDIPSADPAEWRLVVDGAVDRELSLTLDEVRAHPTVRLASTMECAGNGRALSEPRPVSQPWLLGAVGTAEWAGTPLRVLLDAAGLRDDAVEVVLTGADRGIDGGIEQQYARSLTVGDARRDEVLVAYEMNGVPLPPQHGAPLRVVVPGWYGMTNVKWLTRVTATTTPFDGYQQASAYRVRRRADETGTPVTRILPRALLVPPGIPDFLTRRRFVPVGPVRLAGRAWSGQGPIVRVEVSTDGGATWAEAGLEPDRLGPWAWRAWSCDWSPAAPGEHVLVCRATDATGSTQPLEPAWNLGGYLNNACQRVEVTVTAAA